MKPLRYTLTFFLLATIPIMQGCNLFENKCDGDFYFLAENSHHFRLFDYYTGEPLYRVGGVNNRDSVKIFGDDGRIYFNGPVETDGLIYFELLTPDDQGSIN